MSKILKLFIIISTLVMCDVHLIAQNYQVTFKAEGATSTLDSVKVMNLSNCEMVQLNGLDTLLLEQPDYIGSFDMSINNVQVYPNPMYGKCNLKYFSKYGDDLTISIYDLGMRLLISKNVKVEQGTHIFEISGLKSGVYILTVGNGKEIFTQRLVSMSALEVAIDIKYSSYESIDLVNKSLKSLITLDYNAGNTILCEGYSGSLPTVLRTLIVNGDVEVILNFKTQAIEGDNEICQVTQHAYSVEAIFGVIYIWSYTGSGFNIIGGQGTNIIEAEFSDDATSGNIVVIPECSCGELQSKTISVTANPLPTVTATASPSTITSGQSSTLSANGASTYTWSTSQNDSSITVSPTSTTTYTVTGTSTAGCTNTASVTVTVHVGPYCGSQEWMFTNINTGTMVNGCIEQNNNSLVEKYCYNDVEANCDIYGGLYQWAEAVQLDYTYNTSQYGITTSWMTCNPCGSSGRQGICPSGYHIPTDLEWSQYEYCIESTISPTGSTTLSTFQTSTGYRGTNSNAGPGAKMKVTSSNSPSWDGTNASGFAALPAGCRIPGSSFNHLGSVAFFWSASELSSTLAWYRRLYSGYSQSDRSYFNKEYGFSVRCLKD